MLLKIEGKWGVYDIEGKELLPLVYDKIDAGLYNYYVEKNGVNMVIDSLGNIVKQLDDRMNYDIKWVEYFKDAGLYRVYDFEAADLHLYVID